MIGTAYAQAAGGAAGNEFLSLLPMIGIFVVFYFLLIRPQQKRAKGTKAMMESCRRATKSSPPAAWWVKWSSLTKTTSPCR